MNIRSCITGIACALLLESCASKPPPKIPKPVETQTVISASSDANPDSSGRASPVVVRLFQLRGDAEFNGADFFALYDKEKETLAANLIMRDERTVLPGQQVELKLSVAPDARFLGAIAGFRDIQSSHWRAIAAVPPIPEPKKKAPERQRNITVHVEKDAINVSVVLGN
jgi:type VI secretion system protein VasD